MSKLPYVALIILLFLGGALWFTASGSLDDYVKRSIIEQGTNLTGHKVTVEKVNIQTALGQGSVVQLRVAMLPLISQKSSGAPQSEEPSSSSSKASEAIHINNRTDSDIKTDTSSNAEPILAATPATLSAELSSKLQGKQLVEIAKITSFFDKTKLNESPIVIDKLELTGVKFYFPIAAVETALINSIKRQLTVTLNKKISQLNENEQRKQPNFVIKEIVLKDIVINSEHLRVPASTIALSSKGAIVQAKPLSQIRELAIKIEQPESGYPLTILSGKLLFSSLETLTEQAEQQLLVNEMMQPKVQ